MKNQYHQTLAPLRIVKKSLILIKHLIKYGAKRCINNTHEHKHVLQQQLDTSEALKHKFDRVVLGSSLKSVWEKAKNILEILTVDKERSSSKQQQVSSKQ